MDMDPTADVGGFKVAIADPTSGACSYMTSSAAVPENGEACMVQGSVVFNIQHWFDDSVDWALYCDVNGMWANIAKAKKKSAWELPDDADKKWVRIDVDTANKPANTPDSPTSWQRGEATGLKTMNTKCDDAEFTNWAHGGSLFICIHGLTNQQLFIGNICSRGVATDTPNCGGHVSLNGAQITTSSADCPIRP